MSKNDVKEAANKAEAQAKATASAKTNASSKTNALNKADSSAEEIAAAMLYLCSDEAGVINGARLPLTGRG